jgi:spore coat protein JC
LFIFTFIFQIFSQCCLYTVVPEQKARSTYDNVLRLVKDPEVCDPIRFLRAREVAHLQRFGKGLRVVQEHLDSKNFYAFNPAFDNPKENCNCNS